MGDRDSRREGRTEHHQSNINIILELKGGKKNDAYSQVESLCRKVRSSTYDHRH